MITRQAFMRDAFKHRNDNREQHPVLVFLKRNWERAYTVKELCKAIKMKKGTIRSILRALKKDGKIIHKNPYFIYKGIHGNKKRNKR